MIVAETNFPTPKFLLAKIFATPSETMVAAFGTLLKYNYDLFVNAPVFIEQNYDKYLFEKLIEKEYTLDEIAETVVHQRAKAGTCGHQR